MKIIAFDSTGSASSVAVVVDNVVVSSISVDSSLSHSNSLLPAIENSLELASLSIGDLDFIACSVGPGSFTGIRIGLSTAKGLAIASGLKIIPVPTLLALAYNVFDRNSIICPVLDARRDQVYCGFFRWVGDSLISLAPDQCLLILDAISLASNLADELNLNVVFVGDATAVHGDAIVSAGFSFPNFSLNSLSAPCVAFAGLQLIKSNPNCTDSVEPVYLKLPQAQRELLEKLGGDSCEN